MGKHEDDPDCTTVDYCTQNSPYVPRWEYAQKGEKKSEDDTGSDSMPQVKGNSPRNSWRLDSVRGSAAELGDDHPVGLPLSDAVHPPFFPEGEFEQSHEDPAD